MKSFIKKHKEDVILTAVALSAGIISFVVTSIVYPKYANKNTDRVQEVVKNNVQDALIAEIVHDDDEVKIESADTIAVSNSTDENTILIVPTFKEQKNENFIENESKVEKVNKQESGKELKKQKFIMPLTNDILKEFSNDKLLYSKTLNEWQIHSGIDIEGKVGDEIVAFESGIIESIKMTSDFGNTIIITHENGIKSVYSYVKEIDTIKENSKVDKGDVIGKLDESSGFESEDKTHLHFEIIKDGKKISPNDIITSLKDI